jgi:hypothetical protein
VRTWSNVSSDGFAKNLKQWSIEATKQGISSGLNFRAVLSSHVISKAFQLTRPILHRPGSESMKSFSEPNGNKTHPDIFPLLVSGSWKFYFCKQLKQALGMCQAFWEGKTVYSLTFFTQVTMNGPSEEYLLSLWKDKRFSGSFSGLRAFQLALKHEKKLNVSTKRLREVLRKNFTYISHIQPHLRGERRTYDSVHGVFMLFQSDLASFFMEDKETAKEFPYCMVTIDVYSRKLAGDIRHTTLSSVAN